MCAGAAVLGMALFTFLFLAQLSLVIGSCPAGVKPGEFYAAPQAWQKGTHHCEERWPTMNRQTLPRGQEARCFPWRSGEEGSCEYLDLEGGGYHCPTQPMLDTSCESPPHNVTGQRCKDAQCDCQCRQYPPELGTCRCQQCPCGVEGQFGESCDFCPMPDCDLACQAARGLQPGQILSCDFDDSFYTGAGYKLMFPGFIAQPLITLRVAEGRIDMAMYYSLCTKAQQTLLAVNFTECQNGIKSECQANKIPTPCFLCKSSPGVIFPEDTYIATAVQPLMSLVGSGGMMLGCKAGTSIMECQVFFEKMPLNWGWFQCQSGAKCINETSAEGSQVLDAGMVVDAEAEDSYTGFLILSLVISFVCAAVLVVLAVLYKFDVKSQPFDKAGIQLAWDSVSYGSILKGHTGQVGPGALIAVLGPIGAGKSTLLKALAGRLKPTQGSIYLDGRMVQASELRRTIGFVPQEDVCVPEDTVAEAIGFAAAMSCGSFPPLGALAEKRGARIGTLSGGHRRLVNVLVELARRPAILLLDEPTTGLDSDSAEELVKVLKEISTQIPVLCTLHQPGPEIARLLNEVIIVADGEQVCHAGSFNKNLYPVDELTRLIAMSGKQSEGHAHVFDAAIDLAYHGVKLGSTEEQPERAEACKDGNSGAARATGIRMSVGCRQILFLAIRSTKRACKRSPARYLATGVGAVFLGVVFLQTLTLDLAGVRNRFGIFFVIHFLVAMQAVGATAETPAGLVLTEHEINSCAYWRWADALVKVLGQILGQLPHVAIAGLLIYPMVGLRSDGSRPVVFAICTTACSISCCFTALVARQRDQTYMGTARAVCLNGILLLYCGIMLGRDTKESWMVIGKTISPQRYSYELMLAHELIGLSTLFDPKGFEAVNIRGSYYLDQYGFVTKLDDEFYELGHMLGVVSAAWMVIAFLVLLLPPRPLSSLWVRVPSRLAVHGQLEILVQWLESNILLDGKTALQVSKEDVSDCITIGVPGDALEGKADHNASDADAIHPQVREKDVSVDEGKADHNASSGDGAVTEMSWSGLTNPDISDVSGGLRSGNFLGIIGPCGSGKTTLVTMLAGRVKPSSGQINVGRQAMTPRQLSAIVGYVPQFHSPFEDETLRESITFAMATSGKKHPDISRGEAGNQGEQKIKTLSPGQRRVASVAVELARQPMMFVMDEPLSGLDTASSLALTRFLKKLSKSVPVLVTLHQPRPEIAELLTHVMVMRNGKLCLSMPYPELKSLRLSQDSNARVLDGLLSNETLDTLAATPQIVDFACDSSLPPPKRRQQVCKVLSSAIKREICRVFVHKPLRCSAQIVIWLIAGILLGTLYSTMEGNTTRGVLERCGFMFAINATISILTLPRVFEFFDVRKSVLHELESQILHPFVYMACHTVVQVIHTSFCMIVYAVSLMLLTPLKEEQESKILFVIIVCLVSVSCTCFAECVSAWSTSRVSAASVYATALIASLCFATAFIAVDPRPVAAQTYNMHDSAVSFLMHLSVFYYAFNALLRNELQGQEFEWNLGEGVFGSISGEAWLENLDIPQHQSRNILAVLGWLAFFWTFTGLGLLYARMPRKRSAAGNL